MRYRLKGEQLQQPVELSIEIEDEGERAVITAGKWALVKFTADGRIYRYAGIPVDYGFDLDNMGRIKLEED